MTTTEKDNEDDKTGSSVDDEMKLETVLNKFSRYCNPRKNVTILRHNFFTYRQPEGQSFNNFITELKKLSDEWEFENLRDLLIKDMTVCGTNDIAFRKKLLRDSYLALSRAINAGQAAEETRKHAIEIPQS